jgi:nitrogen fixation NifU-like protein
MVMSYGPYPPEVMKHFKNPKDLGSLENPSGIGEVGNVVCGDVMKCYIKVKKNKKGEHIIEDVKMEVFGCIVAIANSSMLTTMVKGKTLEEALKIKKDHLLEKLGDVPPIKAHCSVLASDALHEAIYDYLTKNDLSIPEELEKEHKRIRKTLENIKEKHKHFIEMQEKIMEK